MLTVAFYIRQNHLGQVYALCMFTSTWKRLLQVENLEQMLFLLQAPALLLQGVVSSWGALKRTSQEMPEVSWSSFSTNSGLEREATIRPFWLFDFSCKSSSSCYCQWLCRSELVHTYSSETGEHPYYLVPIAAADGWTWEVLQQNWMA